jgi:hypothetical protein
MQSENHLLQNDSPAAVSEFVERLIIEAGDQSQHDYPVYCLCIPCFSCSAGGKEAIKNLFFNCL